MTLNVLFLQNTLRMDFIKRIMVLLSLATGVVSLRAEIFSLDSVLDVLVMQTTVVRTELLKLQNEMLEFENYSKGFLPSIHLNLSPLNFNRSLKLLQNANDGSYSYIEDYSNNSNAEMSISQRIGITGGTFTASSGLNYLREFSKDRNSFNTMIFNVGYSQPLLGGGKFYKLEKGIRHIQKDLAIKNYCSAVSSAQCQALTLYMGAFLNKLEQDLSFKNTLISDTLLHIAKVKLQQGYITDYEYNQIELQTLNTRYSLEKAQQSYVESLKKLASYLNLSTEIEITYPDNKALPLIISEIEVAENARRNNPQALTIRKQELQAIYTLYQAKMATQFNGILSLNYGANQYAETFVDAYTRPNSSQAVSISFQIPIYQWGINKNKRKIAQNQYDATMMEIQKSQLDFENNIKEMVTSYNYAANLRNIAERTYQLVQERYRLAVKKFELGKVSVYELTLADKEQYSAMKQYYTAINDLYSGYYAIRHITLYDYIEKQDLKRVFMDNDN